MELLTPKISVSVAPGMLSVRNLKADGPAAAVATDSSPTDRSNRPIPEHQVFMGSLQNEFSPHAAHAKTGFYSGFAGVGKVKRTNYIANWGGVKSKCSGNGGAAPLSPFGIPALAWKRGGNVHNLPQMTPVVPNVCGSHRTENRGLTNSL